MEDSDPLGISQMRRIQRGGWTNLSVERIDQTAGGVGDRREFPRFRSAHRWPTPESICWPEFH
jgi:hypothetical protein